MKKLRLLLAGFMAIASLGLASGGTVAAFDLFGDPCKTAKDATVCNESNTGQNKSDNSIYGPHGIITKVANILAIFVGVAAVIVVVIAGIQYMTSTGDSTKVNNAKNAIIYAVVGLMVVVAARTIIVFMIGKLT